MSLNALFTDPLFRSLVDGTSPPPSAFAPNFDILETPAAYTLEGELPGLADKKAVTIEFTDGQTVVISGRIARAHPTPPTPAAEVTEPEHASHHAEVEDVPDEDDKPVEKPAEKKAAPRKQPKIWVSERSVGSFRRVFRFPGAVDTAHVHAALAHGVLTIVVPKLVVPARRIEVE